MSARVPQRPGFLRHLAILWRMRLDVALNRGGRHGRLLAAVSFVLSTAPGWGLGLLFHSLLTWEPIAGNQLYAQFFVNLLCFVTAAVWAIWPILAAGVDDHSEVSRFAAFPVPTLRLLVASMVASLLEPRSLVILAPLAGAALGYARTYAPAWPLVAVVLAILFALLNAAWGRVGLHLVLSVLRQQRSAQAIGGFFVVLLAGASLLPPIDTSWLYALGRDGVNALGTDVLLRATIAFERVPPGYLGAGLRRLARGNLAGGIASGVGLAFWTSMGLAIAYALLRRLQTRTGRAIPVKPAARERNPFARTRDRFATLVAREALDLWRNPRARLLASVPFLLAILLRLLGGHGLFEYLLGAGADAWLMTSLCLYGAVVIASTFSQNTFGYDGHGLALLFAAPIDPADVLRAKNLVHGVAALALALLVGGFYLAYFRAGGPVEWAFATCAVLAAVPVLLAAGNVLSLAFPVKFHANLERRDRLPFAASMLGVAAAGLAASPAVLLLRLAAGRPSWGHVAVLACVAVVAFALYRAALANALGLLSRRREALLIAVTRE